MSVVVARLLGIAAALRLCSVLQSCTLQQLATPACRFDHRVLAKAVPNMAYVHQYLLHAMNVVVAGLFGLAAVMRLHCVRQCWPRRCGQHCRSCQCSSGRPLEQLATPACHLDCRLFATSFPYVPRGHLYMLDAMSVVVAR